VPDTHRWLTPVSMEQPASAPAGAR
jgi:hypothetical protein